MRLHHLLLVIPFALVSQLSIASNDMDITDVTCTVSHINEVAQKEGLENAQALAQSCIAAGYDDVEKQVKEAGNTLMDHYEAAKSYIGENTDESSEKAEHIKKELSS